MEQLAEIYTWLFNTRAGMATLIFGGMAIFALIALVMERRTHKQYFNHPKTDDDDDWGSWLSFGDDDDEDGTDEDKEDSESDEKDR